MKQGQAAIEFLTTYGWAMLLILFIITIIIYFGLLNPQVQVKAYCDFGPQMACSDFAIGQDAGEGKIAIYLQNHYGTTMDFNATSFEVNIISCNGINSLANGRVGLLSCNYSDNNYGAGDRLRIPLMIKFRQSGAATWYNVSGVVSTKMCSGGLENGNMQGC
ncbi:MAG: hypothetical protein ABIH41_03545 [Nanoarchaeota archaeon]